MNAEASIGGMPEAEGVFYADGSLNEEFIAENYGLGIEEASQEIKFGSHTGTVAQMLADESCPMGGRLQGAYQEKGLDGVLEVFEGAKMMDPDFSVKVSEATIEREHAKRSEVVSEDPVVEQETGKNDSPEPPESPTPTSHTLPDREVMEERAAIERRETEVDVPPAGGPPPKEQADKIVADETTAPVEEVLSVAAPTQPEDPAVIMDSIPTPVPTPVVEVVPSPAPTYKREQVVAQVPIQAEPATNLTNTGDLAEPEMCLQAEIEPEQLVDLDVPAPIEMIGAEVSQVEEFVASLQLIDEEKIDEPELMTPAAVELARQVSEALSLPEIMETEPVREAVAEIDQSLEIIRLLVAAGEDVSAAEQQLVLACEALFDELGIDYERETVEQFAKLVLAVRVMENEAQDEMPSMVPGEAGTHEYKSSDDHLPWALVRGAKQKLSLWIGLGHSALEGSLATI